MCGSFSILLLGSIDSALRVMAVTETGPANILAILSPEMMSSSSSRLTTILTGILQLEIPHRMFNVPSRIATWPVSLPSTWPQKGRNVVSDGQRWELPKNYTQSCFFLHAAFNRFYIINQFLDRVFFAFGVAFPFGLGFRNYPRSDHGSQKNQRV